MASSPSQYLAVALSGADSSFALSYSHPDQKYIIKKHILLLLQEFPFFSLSSDLFTHDHGGTVRLLNLGGYLYVSSSAPPIPVMIWVHEDYPYTCPTVFVLSVFEHSVKDNHPFVKRCGTIVTPYIRTWAYPGCNLTDLVRNLFKLFSYDHPFVTILKSRLTHPSLVSKREAVDRLVGSFFSDATALTDVVLNELYQLKTLQTELLERSDVAKSMIISLEHEKLNLKKIVLDILTEADMLWNWLSVHCPKLKVSECFNDVADKAFEAADERSETVLEHLAAEKGLEDVMSVLEKGLEEGVVSSEVYFKQVRNLAREQFLHKYTLHKIV